MLLNNSCVKWIYYTCISLYVHKIQFIILASFLHLRTSLMEKKIKSKKVHFSYFLCSLDTSFTRPWIELHHWHTGCVSSNAQYLYYIRIFEGRIRYWTELYTSLFFCFKDRICIYRRYFRVLSCCNWWNTPVLG